MFKPDDSVNSEANQYMQDAQMELAKAFQMARQVRYQLGYSQALFHAATEVSCNRDLDCYRSMTDKVNQSFDGLASLLKLLFEQGFGQPELSKMIKRAKSESEVPFHAMQSFQVGSHSLSYPKFNIGQLVQCVNEQQSTGYVVGLSFDHDAEVWTYKVLAEDGKEDFICLEERLELVVSDSPPMQSPLS